MKMDRIILFPYLALQTCVALEPLTPRILIRTVNYEGKEDSMSKRVYISADYSIYDGDRDVIDVLHSWRRVPDTLKFV